MSELGPRPKRPPPLPPPRNLPHPPPPVSSRGSPSGVILLLFPGFPFMVQKTSPEKIRTIHRGEYHHDGKQFVKCILASEIITVATYIHI
ncbi:MAG: hypothetical protein WBP83_06190 [Nitrososphaeraceae archaeon]